MSDVAIHTVPAMGTVVTVQVVGHGETAERRALRDEAMRRATDWFRMVEVTCSRFDPRSELRTLCTTVETPVPLSSVLFELLVFAVAVARESGGAFDPTVGGAMEARGFTRHFRTGAEHPSGVAATGPTFEDISVDRANRTATLHRALMLDLGGVAKGFAADLAARELAEFGDFAIDAGGDQFLSGRNATGDLWSVGIRHPRKRDDVVEVLQITDVAICTSGDYERVSSTGAGGHHLIDPRGGSRTAEVASATVIAPTAMAADALATAAFVLGPERGTPFLERQGASGVWYDATLQRHATTNFASMIDARVAR
ncbi:MAG: FAD:protein FMN transferase [Gemmatimonadota bacterium]|nr:FAD:protein FMN transferase [Gemmatimonadota bacterium]